MAATAAPLGAYLSTEAENEQLVRHVISLWEQGMHGSTRILGDLLLANPQALGLLSHPKWHLAVLLAYADGLMADQQYERAVRYYREAVRVSGPAFSSKETSSVKLPTETEIKWKVYRCHVLLRQHQQALDTLSSIPLRKRDAKVALALADLYKNYVNDSRSAMVCYQQALSMCPYAMEAVVGLLSLGMALPEVLRCTIPRSTHHTSPLTTSLWLMRWLEIQDAASKYEFESALVGFENLTKMGFSLSPNSTSQLAWCLAKTKRKVAALELFSTARTQDPFILKHMDTFARIQTDSKKLERLGNTLMAVSRVHAEPWIAKAWHQIRNTDLQDMEYTQCTMLMQNAYCYSLRNAEVSFCDASLCQAKHDEKLAIHKYQEAVHIDPSFFDAYEALVQCYLSMRREREAVNLARAASRHVKKPALQYYLQGIAWSQNRATTDKCRLLLERAVKADPSFQQAILQLGSLYLQEGALANTVDLYLEHTKSCNTPLLHTELASCLARLKRYQEAMEHYSLALSQDPTFEKAVQGVHLLQHHLNPPSSSSGRDLRSMEGMEEEEELEGMEDLVSIRPLQLDNPLEVDSDEEETGSVLQIHQEYQS